MEGKAALAQTLRDYPGGVLLVSHDRQLISESCNRFWLIDSAGLTEWHSLEEVYARLQAVAPPGQSARFAEYTRRG
ncbi:putative transporter ATP-binding component [Klebsiella pneumoniae]|uniref:Putative transporter ATP-binding component n=1 Tax=Klebsiella pneumoniae TaxID=573 RepID=A0A2X3F1C2_KLEPN|nr:putative transporter ATP-binding component [Klebsiella pneumoniae]